MKIQEPVQAFLDQLVAEGSERGVQAAVYHNGELVADAYAGVTDPQGTRKVDSETLFPVFSTTKGIAATLAHLMVERDKVAYETPLAAVWPEFSAHGKEGITLRHVLNHTAGMQNMPLNLTHEQLCDWDTMCDLLAAATPVSAPGARFAYHGMTYSWLVGEVIHRVDGRSFQQVLHDEIAAPLGIADEMFVGIPERVEPRVAFLETTEEKNTVLPHAATDLAVPLLVQPLHAWMNRPDARRACIPASNGIMTARSVAKHYAALLPRGVDGVELLPPSRIRHALEENVPTEHPAGEPLPTHRLGYAQGHPFPTSFGHGGFGDSMGMADPSLNLAIGFARNRFVTEGVALKLSAVVRQALEL